MTTLTAPAPPTPAGTTTPPPSRPSAPRRATLRAFIQRHPVLAFYALTFALSWSGFLLVGGAGLVAGTDWQADPRFMPAVLAMLAGPPVAGLLLTGLVAGRAGYRALLARLLRWRVGARWYAVALLPAPLLMAATLSALSLRSTAFLPAIVTAKDKTGLVLAGIAVGLLGGLVEELGWTGFAIPRLRRRHDVLATGLIVGVLWGAWHLLQMSWVGATSSEALPPALFLLQYFSSAVATLTAYRVLMVWVYDRTGSLLLAVLMHASYIASTLFVLAPPTTGVPFLTYAWVWTAVLWLAVAAVAMASWERTVPAGGLLPGERGATMRAVIRPPATNGPSFTGRRPEVPSLLLALGVLAPIYYVVVNEVVAALRYPGYDPIARPVSELTATYAPTRPILVPLLVIFDVLIVPFWIGIWRAAQANRALRLTAGLMLGFRALALLAFPFPMVADEVLGANTVHTIIWGVLTPLLMLASIGASAFAFGKTFRVYAILTLVALVTCSAATGILAAQITAGAAVRWFGIAERALIGIWLQWVAVLAIVLLRAQRERFHSLEPNSPTGGTGRAAVRPA